MTSTEVLPRNFAGSIMAAGREITISETVSVSSAWSETVLLVGAGPIPPRVAELITGFPGRIVAADGGAAAALTLGLHPDRVIGDLDSLDAGTRARLGPTPILHDTDQDSTDFEKCLRRIETREILGVGFLGGRADHSLAALSTLIEQGNKDILLLGEEDVVFRVPQRIILDLDAGTRVSLFPMGAVRGSSSGLQWPIDGIDLSPGERVATSNRATGPVSISSQGPLLAILPLDCLMQARDALLRVRSR